MAFIANQCHITITSDSVWHQWKCGVERKYIVFGAIFRRRSFHQLKQSLAIFITHFRHCIVTCLLNSISLSRAIQLSLIFRSSKSFLFPFRISENSSKYSTFYKMQMKSSEKSKMLNVFDILNFRPNSGHCFIRRKKSMIIENQCYLSFKRFRQTFWLHKRKCFHQLSYTRAIEFLYNEM